MTFWAPFSKRSNPASVGSGHTFETEGVHPPAVSLAVDAQRQRSEVPRWGPGPSAAVSASAFPLLPP